MKSIIVLFALLITYLVVVNSIPVLPLNNINVVEKYNKDAICKVENEINSLVIKSSSMFSTYNFCDVEGQPKLEEDIVCNIFKNMTCKCVVYNSTPDI